MTHPEAECDTEMPSQYRRLRFHIWRNCETFIHVPVNNTFVGIPLNTPFLLPLTPFQLYQCQGALFGVTHEEAKNTKDSDTKPSRDCRICEPVPF